MGEARNSGHIPSFALASKLGMCPELRASPNYGRGPQLRAHPKLGCQGETCHYFSDPRTILGGEFRRVPDSRSEPEIGEFTARDERILRRAFGARQHSGSTSQFGVTISPVLRKATC